MRMFLPFFAALIGVATPAWSRDGAAQGSSWQPNLLDPSSFLRSLPRQAVISATQYGARPNDGIDDSNAISAALAGAQAHRAAAVLLPAGNYDIGSAVRLVSNVALMGEGCARTRLTRGVSNHSQMLLRLDGGTNVRVQGIAFDHNAGPPFTRSIGLRGAGSHGLVILDNCFNDSRPYTQGGDRWAIALGAETSPSSRIWIGRNRSNGGMQLTAGGDPGITTLRIVDNDVRNGRNAGIAVSHLDSRAVFRDLVIARNRIDNALGLGVFLGPD
ncbi:MAG: glycosyl hydrolase family 28-related protein, partial [Sphingomicrobium sp.]